MKKRLMHIKGVAGLSFCAVLSACSTFKDVTNVDLWPFGKSGDQGHEYLPANSTPYVCDGKKKFFVRVLDQGASIWLMLPDREVALAQVGSSKVYSNGITKLDLTSDDAMLEVNETTKYVGCKSKSAASVSKVEAQPVQVAKSDAKPVAKAEAKPQSEKSWFDRMKFWESDDKVKPVEKAEPAPLAVVAKEEVRAPQISEVKVVEPVAEAQQAKPDSASVEVKAADEAVIIAEPAPLAVVAKEEMRAPQISEVKVVEPVAEAQQAKPDLVPVKAEAADEALSPQGDAQVAVAKAVDAWASAWRTKNANAYLNFYSAKFKPEGMSKKAWKAQRKQRVGASPAEITLTLDKLNVVADAKKATATFAQHYASGKYSDDVVKVLNFENVKGEWLIVKERAKATSAKLR